MRNMHSYPGKNAFWVFVLGSLVFEKPVFSMVFKPKKAYKTNGFLMIFDRKRGTSKTEARMENVVLTWGFIVFFGGLANQPNPRATTCAKGLLAMYMGIHWISTSIYLSLYIRTNIICNLIRNIRV